MTTERDDTNSDEQAVAAIERVRALADSWDAEGWDYPAGAAYDLRAALSPAPTNEARGGNTDNTLRAVVDVLDRTEWDGWGGRKRLTERLLAVFGAAPAPTDNQRDDGLAVGSSQDRHDVASWLIREADQRVKFFPQRRDGVDEVMRATAAALRAVVDGPTT